MHALLRGTWIDTIRLSAGLVLFAFAFFHFFNHAIGLWGPAPMEAFRSWRVAVTRSQAGELVLLAAITLHVVLGLYKLARRSTWRMPAWEALQIGLGLAIPFLLFPHIVNTRIAHEVYAVDDTYRYELIRLWPAFWFDQSVLLLLVWIHGTLGLHHWLRLSRTCRRMSPALLVLASLLPLAALAGFMVGGRMANATFSEPAAFAALKAATNWPDARETDQLAAYRVWARRGFGAAVVLALTIPLFRQGRRRLQGLVRVRYAGGRQVHSHPGPTLLEISRINRIPHLSVCGGRARCSTCRVRVVEGLSSLAPPAAGERITLKTIGAGPDVRLACQIRPHRDMSVVRLLGRGSAEGGNLAVVPLDAAGTEREIAILFLDIRGFSAIAENRLPYDVVFILNRCFAETGAAIETAGGRIDKYMGDGLLAVFGERGSPAEGCRQAIEAARLIDLALDRVNLELADLVSRPLTIRMGIHAGPLVLGLIGHGRSASATVIGDTVNIASRLESLCEEFGCQLVVSTTVFEEAGTAWEGLPSHMAKIRGLAEPVRVVTVDSGRSLGERLHAPAA